MSGILKYFHIVKKSSSSETNLPDPNGPLSRVIPSSTIAAANEKVCAIEKMPGVASRTPYLHLTSAQKYQVGKRAAEFGTTNTLRYYARHFPSIPLKETSVRRFKSQYQSLLDKKKYGECSHDDEVCELPSKKMGRPLLIGDEADKQLQEYVRYLRATGAAVNTAVVIASAEGILLSKDANILKRITLTKDWAKSLLIRMGMVKRRVSSKAKVDVEKFEALRQGFLLDIKNIVSLEEIPPDLIINWDQTGINYVPVDSWTMEKEGARRVELAGKDDKRQLTAVFAGSMTGEFLPPQLIYQGKTHRCIPKVEFPDDWDVTFSANHWSNERTMTDYIEKILLPYVEGKRQELQLASCYPALVIFDNFKAQCTAEILQMLDDHHIYVILLPPNCTDRLQPMDLSVNKPAKDFLRKEFNTWYSKQVCSQFQGKSEKCPIDTRASVVKPLGAEWMKALFDYFKGKPEIICNGFKEIKSYLDK